MRILLIEDDQELSQTIKSELVPYYVVESVSLGEDGVELSRSHEYDLIVVDLVLPDINGIEVCKTIRKYSPHTPILVLTGTTNIESKVDALDFGADDYLTKPFEFKELSARIRALLRRNSHNMTSNILSIDGLSIDLAARTVERDGRFIRLRRKEFSLLEYLVRNAGRVITRNMILDHVWESANEPVANAIDVHIKYLRDQIDKPFNKKLIKTVHGIGYKIET